VRLEGLGKLKKSNYFIGNGTRELPACSTVQPTTLLRTYIYAYLSSKGVQTNLRNLVLLNFVPFLLKRFITSHTIGTVTTQKYFCYVHFNYIFIGVLYTVPHILIYEVYIYIIIIMKIEYIKI
jgi:hypothetical protein